MTEPARLLALPLSQFLEQVSPTAQLASFVVVWLGDAPTVYVYDYAGKSAAKAFWATQPGFAGWYDSSDGVSIATSFSSGGSGSQAPYGALAWLRNGDAVVNGATVDWPDASGNGNDAIGSGALSIVMKGGKPFVQGWNAGKITNSSLVLNDSDGFQVFVVCQRYSIGAIQGLFNADGTGGGGLNFVMALDAYIHQVVGVNGAGQVVPTATWTGGVNQNALADVRLFGGNAYAKVNGGAEAGLAYPYGGGGPHYLGGPIGFQLGQTFRNDADPFNGGIAEVLIYRGSQNPAPVRAYLAGKFGITQ